MIINLEKQYGPAIAILLENMSAELFAKFLSNIPGKSKKTVIINGVMYRDAEIYDYLRGQVDIWESKSYRNLTPPHKIITYIDLLHVEHTKKNTITRWIFQGNPIVFMEKN